MKKMIYAYLLMGSTFSASAIPNYWSESFAQGYMEYGISNDKHLSVILACNIAANDDMDNGVHLYQDGNPIGSDNIAFIIDDEVYYIPDETQTRGNGNLWYKFAEAIAKATQFEVYVDDKPIGKFQPNKKNRVKIFTDFDCPPLYYREISH